MNIVDPAETGRVIVGAVVPRRSNADKRARRAGPHTDALEYSVYSIQDAAQSALHCIERFGTKIEIGFVEFLLRRLA
jgi:hypothetical protein